MTEAMLMIRPLRAFIIERITALLAAAPAETLPSGVKVTHTLVGTGANPNVAAVVVIGIEPEWTRIIVEGIAKTGNVWALFVRPDAQGRGHGTRLHAAMIEWFRKQPIDRLWLSTGTTTKARDFYDKNGWECVGPDGSEEVRYERANAA